MHTRGRGGGGGEVEESVIKYKCTEWMAPDKCCGISFVHWSDQVH